MKHDSLLRIENGRELKISCDEGILWITQAGDFQDFILASRERFVINREGLVIVSAITDACLNVIF
ncbi:MAG: DUF2917 domain-containing protein [Nitrospirota bacterium]